MFSLVPLFLCLPAVTPQAPSAPAQKPTLTAQLFAHAMIVGGDISDGVGLEKELGAPGSMSDVVQASLLFDTQHPVERHVFAETNVAHQQIEAAQQGQATLVIALDYLIPYVYAMQTDDARKQQVATALKALEVLKCPIVLGDVPDLRAGTSGTNGRSALADGQVPSAETLKALNESITAWAATRKDVAIAPVAMVFAHVEGKEPFTIRNDTWGQAWLPDLLQSDHVHTRLHGAIALWIGGLDALCQVRKDVDARLFDWNALSIYKKIYDSKARERQKALDEEVTRLRPPPTRPPPQPPPPAPPPDENAKREARKKAQGGSDQDSDKGGG
jgi:hypothetical protein